VAADLTFTSEEGMTMTRWLGCVALAAALAVGLAARADKKADPKADKKADSQATREFTGLQLQFKTEELAADKDAAKRKAVHEKFTPKFLDHAKKNPKDDSAVLALEVVLELNPAEGKSKVRKEAIELLKKEYVKSKQILPILRTLANQSAGLDGDAALLEIVKAVAKDNPDKLTRATALDELASSLEFQALEAGKLLRDEKRLAEYEKQFGRDLVRKFVGSTGDMTKDVEGLRKTLESDYAGVLPDDDNKKDDTKDVLKVGAKAPETVCTDIAGSPVKLSDHVGKVVVLDFWATWCGPCRAMIPHTREMVKENEKKPFVFVSVSCDAKRETLTDFTAKTEMPWTHWWDGQGGKVARTYQIMAFPTIYVIDHKGVIQFKCVGYDKKLDSVVKKLVKDAESEKK
jgi:thiol-disulfide isomerase/thioredoxin